MKKTFVALAGALCWALNVQAQTIVNTETLMLKGDSGFIWTAGVSGTVSVGNINVINGTADWGLTKDWGTTAVKLIGSWKRLAKDGASIQSSAFTHLRLEQGDVDKVQGFGFVQVSSNDVLLMTSRNLAGAGVKHRFLNTERAMLAVSWGGFWEVETYNAEVPDARILRNSLILSGRWQMTESISVRFTTYAQTDFQNFDDTRLFLECSWDAAVAEHVALEWNFALRWDGEPHAGLEPLDIGSTVGLRFGLK